MFRGGSLTLGRVRGVPIRAHWTLLLVIPYLAFIFATQFGLVARLSGVAPHEVVLPPLLWGVLIAVGLFASVAAHELAHTLVALRVGARVRAITLMLLGGVSQMERMPQRPRNEAIMAAAGPLSSIAIAVFLWLLLGVRLAPDLRLGVYYLAYLNFLLGLFNFLPAFPMDGGRVLRALLAGRLGMLRATRIAAGVGRVAAVALGLWGLLAGNWLLILIAIFLYSGAGLERQVEEQREALGRLQVGDVMSRRPGTIGVDEAVAVAPARMREAARLELVVTGDFGEPMGVLHADDLRALDDERRRGLRVGELGPRLARRAIVVTPSESARDALDRAAASGAEYLLVASDERLVGIVGPTDLDHALALRRLDERRPARRGADLRPREV